MNPKLSQIQRVVTAFVYLVILSIIFTLIGGNFKSQVWTTSIDSSIWFYSGAFMIVLGKYIVEPFFTKPSDVIANSMAVLISLLGLSAKQNLIGYKFIFYYAVLLLVLSIITITLRDVRSERWSRVSRILYWFVESFGRSEVIFSVVYLFSAYSYFANKENSIVLISVIAFWICLMFFDVVGKAIYELMKLSKYLDKKTQDELGQAIGCENPLLYKIEIDYSKNRYCTINYGDLVAVETSQNIGSIGMVVNTKFLLNKKWLSVYLLRDTNGEIIRIGLNDKKLITDPKSIFSKENLAYQIKLSELTDEILKAQIQSNPLYKNSDNFVGYVTIGSNINTINFLILREFDELKQEISEGSILQTLIYKHETLYQVINGNSKEEVLENYDRYGYTVGIARKLGIYKLESKELDVSKWMPSVFSPVFFAYSQQVSKKREKEIAKNSVGRLPGTGLEIPIKDINSLVTHNTAILGILGIGKSCLTFELIKKITAQTNSKVICLDITNEYQVELSEYGCTLSTIDVEVVNARLQPEYEAINKDVNKGGNHAQFRQIMTELITGYLSETNKNVLVINPEEYDVSKQTNDLKPKKVGDSWIDQAPMTDLSLVEKTRIISEIVLEFCKSKGRISTSRCLIVFEEAHSLIPEWNSVASDGDKSATNGIAKVVLQGRKYGLGSMVVTQRTANVSKSILNQCNTIFALRVFDDTGKTFLENYIGQDYADTLATLEERHAIAIGKALKLKQPVIVQLNDRANIV